MNLGGFLVWITEGAGSFPHALCFAVYFCNRTKGNQSIYPYLYALLRRNNLEVSTVRPDLRALLAIPSNPKHIRPRREVSRDAKLIGDEGVVGVATAALAGVGFHWRDGLVAKRVEREGRFRGVGIVGVRKRVTRPHRSRGESPLGDIRSVDLPHLFLLVKRRQR